MRSMKMTAAVALLAALGAPSDEAAACINGTERRLDEVVAAIAVADRDVAEGRPVAAAQQVLNRYPAIRSQVLGKNPVVDRALRVMARAVVRTAGAIDAGSRFPGGTEAERKANLDWAVRVLHGFVNQNPTDAEAKTDYGEALVRVEGRRAEALRVLGDLAARDLIGSAQGYAALAELYRAAGEGKLAFIAAPARALASARLRLAEARCRRMAPDPESICEARHQAGPES